MATSNFSRGNTSKVFAVLMNREENFKECSECGEKHQDYEYNEESYKNLSVCSSCGCEDLEEKSEYVSPDEWEYDELKDYIKETAKEEIKELKTVWYKEESGSDNARQYTATDLFSFNTSKSYGDIEVEIKITGQIVGAYYEGASLDYRLEIYGGGDWCEVESGRYTTTEADILDDLFAPDYEHYYSDMNKGMRKIQMGYATKWAEKETEQLKELIEEVFTKVSQPLNVVATFSNGETIYANA
jgi:hypothetical protein